eukprot:m51a1_g1822 putative actin cortical patch component lsb4 (320) ;mRNA; r:503096-504355
MGLKDRAASCLPSPRDFAPSRFARKTSMAVGYACLVALVPTVAALASGSWTHYSLRSRSAATDAAVETTLDAGLARWSMTTTTPAGTARRSGASLGSLPLSAGDLREMSGVALGLLVTALLLEPLAAALSFKHAWARGNQRVAYVWAVGAHFVVFSLLLAALLAYRGGEPDASEYSLGWGFWLELIVVVVWFVLLVATAIDKPTGFYRVTKHGLVAEEEEDPEVGPKQYAVGITLAEEQQHQYVPPAAASQAGAPAASAAAAPARTCKALYQCTAERPGDLEFERGDVITVVSDAPGSGWMTGRIGDREGIFPANYVQL